MSKFYCKYYLLAISIFPALSLFAQADNEIQVYASPTIGKMRTIFELHSNYTFKGSKLLPVPDDAHWLNETLEITHGFKDNFELGFYLFTALAPDGSYQYLGNQIRPRISAEENWNLPFGLSLSVEFGFFRPDKNSDYFWQGEIRPIFDISLGNLYMAFNPNLGFSFENNNSTWEIAPQFKTVYTLLDKIGLGFEYYAALGTFDNIPSGNLQEHLIGPMLDLYAHPDWELNTGFLFGLTENSNQSIIKILVGKRINWSD